MSLTPLLENALQRRAHEIQDPSHESAFRLFNGFYEGDPSLAADIYGRTLLIHDYAEAPHPQDDERVAEIIARLRTSLGWLSAGILKRRNGKTQEERRGVLLFGSQPDDRICEHGVWHAIDLTMNRDASFYLDTALLRKWLIENSRGKSVLNAFAYTGSLGVAAKAGGASRVMQIDLSRKFLSLGQRSYALNHFPLQKGDFIARDFFEQVGGFKRNGTLFDIVLIDPPFFSTTEKGKIDQNYESARLVNKVRPLVADGGVLIAVNNALYVSGAAYMQSLETLCADGYLRVRELIPVPQSYLGAAERPPITDPTPFNHSTKIALLDVKRKKAA